MDKLLKLGFFIVLFAALAFFSVIVAVAFGYAWWGGIFFFVFFIALYHVGKYAFRMVRQSKFVKLDIQAFKISIYNDVEIYTSRQKIRAENIALGIGDRCK
jgi:membrane protein implicated in regulation of membrane protease activity